MRRVLWTTSVLLLMAGVAQAGMSFEATLTRAQSVPTPQGGLLTGASVRVDFDDGLTEARVRLITRGGQNVRAAHFHCALPGETGPVAFGLFSPGPLSFNGFSAAGVLTNDDYTGSDCSDAVDRSITNIAALAFAMQQGLVYINLHTTDNGPGEVRGQLVPVAGGGGPLRRNASRIP